MRRPIIIGLTLSTITAAACAGWLYLRPHDKLAEAQHLMAAGDMRAAALVLRNILQTNPDSAEARFRLGQAQLRLGDPAAAEKDFRAARDLGWDAQALVPLLAQAVAAQGRNAEVLRDYSPEKLNPAQAATTLLARATAQMNLNKPDDAAASIAEAQRLAPGSFEVAMAAARLATARNDTAGALARIDTALKIDPQAIEALLLQATLRVAIRDNQGALASYAAALQQAQRTGATAAENFARTARAGLLLSVNDNAGAQADVSEVLKSQPRNQIANFLSARLLARSGNWADANTALSIVGPALQRLSGGDLLLAVVKMNLHEPEQAIAAAERQTARTPSDLTAAKLLARLELAEQRPNQAVRVLTAATLRLDGEALDLLGTAYAAGGQPDKALDTLKQISALLPDDPRVLSRLAALEMTQGQANQAMQDLNRALDLTPPAARTGAPAATKVAIPPTRPGEADAPTQAQTAAALVLAALRAGEIDQAATALNRLREANPEPAQLANLTGIVKMAQFDLAGAKAAFQDARTLNPHGMEPRINLARVLALEGHSAEAVTLLQTVMTDDPTNGVALTALVDLLLRDKQPNQAITAAEAAHHGAPDNTGITVVLGALYLRTSQPAKTLALLDATKTAAGAQPGSPASKLPPALAGLQAQAQFALGQRAPAEQTLRALLDLTPTNAALRRQLAEMMAVDKNYDDARALLREGLNRSPANAILLAASVAIADRENGPAAAVARAEELALDPANSAPWLPGDVLVSQHKITEAASNYQAKLASLPKGDAHATALMIRIAQAVNAADDPGRSATMLRNWLASDPDNVPLMLALSELDLAANRAAPARAGLEGVLVRQPNNPTALNNLAWLNQQQGNLTTARAMATRAYLLAPSPQSADTLGWILLAQGGVPAAVALLREAANGQPQDPGIHYHLAAALAKDGQKEGAVALLKTIVGAPAGGFSEMPQATKLLSELSAP